MKLAAQVKLEIPACIPVSSSVPSSPPVPNTPPSPVRVTAALEAWFDAHGRDYPWRRTTDPYAILVSEMMLQQTQISTVLDRGYYARWMERFPHPGALAEATEAEVLRLWEGLGYYRRARFLHQMAQTVTRDLAGVFPTDLASVRELPGVGDYTAGAVCSFAYDARVPLVDGNVARVLSRLWNDATPVDSKTGQTRLWSRARALVEEARSPRVLNSALMELGQRFCRTGTPACKECPVQPYCQAEDPASLPVKSKQTLITAVTERVFYHQNEEGVILEQESGSRRTGLWKLPSLPEQIPHPPVVHHSRYTITRYKVELWVHAGADGCEPGSGQRRVPASELRDLPMPSPYRRALNALLAHRDFRLEA